MSDFIEGFLGFLIHLFLEIICFYTGEIILFLVTCGWKKPRWNYYLDDSVTTFVLMTEISTWIGFGFWALVTGFGIHLFI